MKLADVPCWVYARTLDIPNQLGLLSFRPLMAGIGLVIYFIMEKPPAPAAIETELTPAQEQELFGDIRPDRFQPRNLD